MRFLYLLSALLFLGTAIGMVVVGPNVPYAFDMSEVSFDNQVPDSIGFGPAMLGLMFGWALATIGLCWFLFKADAGVAYSRKWRSLHIVGGLLTIIAGVTGLFVLMNFMWALHEVTNATGTATPEPLSALCDSMSSFFRVAYILLIVAGVLFVISALRFMGEDQECARPTPDNWKFVLLGFVGLSAIAIIFVFLIQMLDEFKTIGQIVDLNSMNDRGRFREYLSIVNTSGRFGFSLIALAGLLQVICGWLGPGDGIRIGGDDDEAAQK